MNNLLNNSYSSLNNHYSPLTHNVDLRKIRLAIRISLLGIFFLTFLGIISLFQGELLLGCFDLLMALLFVGLFWLLKFKKKYTFCVYLATIIGYIFFNYLFITGGVEGTASLWSYCFPLTVFFFLGRKKGLLISLFYLTSCSIILLVNINTAMLSIYDTNFAIRFVCSLLTVILFSYMYETHLTQYQNAFLDLANNLEHKITQRTEELMVEVQKKDAARRSALCAKRDWERTFDAVPDLIMILDEDYQIVRANKAMASALNIPIEELVNRKCYEVIHGTDGPPLDCPQRQLLDNHKTHFQCSFEPHLQRYIETTVSPIFDDSGSFIGTVHVSRDLTDQKKIEDENNAARKRLRKAEKMEAVGLMASGVAHDLNNILSGIVSYPEILLLQLTEDDELYTPIKAIQDSGKRAASVVSDLLTVTRGVATIKQVGSPNSFIGEYVDSIEFQNLQENHKNIEFELICDKNSWNILCVPVHIQKVIMNLTINAVESISGDGKVSITSANKTVHSQSDKTSRPLPGDYVSITVSDTGTGIPPEDIDHIFEPFYTKKVMGKSGTGLGLAVIWNIMEDHNAYIDVQSDKDGTTFTCNFKRCHQAEVPIQPPLDMIRLQGEGTILIVDDEEQQRLIASEMLGLLGYTVLSVKSGEEAVSFFKEKQADLILLDMVMGTGFNGLQTYEKIIQLCPAQKAVIASGFSDTANINKILQLGPTRFIKKPYSIEDLGSALKSVLDESVIETVNL